MRADGASITIVGRAATNPVVANAGGTDRVTLRVVANERRYDDSTQQWVDGDEYGVNVVCWRQVAAGVLRVVRKGDPVVVLGRISTRKFERNGATEYFTDVKGDFVGFDLARAKDRIRRSDVDSRDASVAETPGQHTGPADQADFPQPGNPGWAGGAEGDNNGQGDLQDSFSDNSPDRALAAAF